MAQAALSGNINTVGLLELLRIPMTTKRNGTLIVICADPDAADVEARFRYEGGTLVAGALGELTGEAALRRMLTWSEGEFEFLADATFDGPNDPNLHRAALTELKAWYSARTGGSATSIAPPTANKPAPASSVVAPRGAASPSALSRYQPARPQVTPPPPPSSALGSGVLDTRGNLREAMGQLSPRDGALIFAGLQVGAAIGRDMGLGNPTAIEMRGKGARWLAASVRGDAAVAIACPPDTDMAEELARR